MPSPLAHTHEDRVERSTRHAQISKTLPASQSQDLSPKSATASKIVQPRGRLSTPSKARGYASAQRSVAALHSENGYTSEQKVVGPEGNYLPEASELSEAPQSPDELRVPDIVQASGDWRVERPFPALPAEICHMVLCYVDVVTLWSSCRKVSHAFSVFSKTAARLEFLPKLKLLAWRTVGGNLSWPLDYCNFRFQGRLPADPTLAVYQLGPSEDDGWHPEARPYTDRLSLRDVRDIILEPGSGFTLHIDENDDGDVLWTLDAVPEHIQLLGVPSEWSFHTAVTPKYWRGSAHRPRECIFLVDWKSLFNIYIWQKKSPTVGNEWQRRAGKRGSQQGQGYGNTLCPMMFKLFRHDQWVNSQIPGSWGQRLLGEREA